MPIMAKVSAQQEAQGQTRLGLDKLIRIIKNQPSHDLEQEMVFVGRVYDTTQAAADPAHAFHTEFRKMYDKALGSEEAGEFLRIFNTACETYRDNLQAEKKGVRLTCEKDAQPKLVAYLTKLKEATDGYGGFHFPYPGMGHERTGPCF